MINLDTYIESLKRELDKNKKIVLQSPRRGQRIIVDITNTHIVYKHAGGTSKDTYSIQLLKDTYAHFYGQTVSADKLEQYNTAYSEKSGTPCGAIMFILLMNYWFQIPIIGNGTKGNPVWIVLVHNGIQPSLWRIFMKNIMLRESNRYLSVRDNDDVRHAVELAYLSMQPRTFRKASKNKKITINANLKNLLFDFIAREITTYFCGSLLSTVAFDQWHDNLCNQIQTKLCSLLTVSGYDSSKATYGKAQKILNVAFKNIYLFDDACFYEDYFLPCHFILDSSNLKWYQSKVATTIAPIIWSNLSEATYKKIQIDIRNYLNTQYTYPQIPFYAEFYVWSEYQF